MEVFRKGWNECALSREGLDMITGVDDGRFMCSHSCHLVEDGVMSVLRIAPDFRVQSTGSLRSELFWGVEELTSQPQTLNTSLKSHNRKFTRINDSPQKQR
jgi:hypothetical protein